ncbi:hypothetical protein S7335_4729 [Synechococcus sp. PCC 7335]|nr:hypothetical protein S7335_4729 [Synechococcus sp. PCC 7335]
MKIKALKAVFANHLGCCPTAVLARDSVPTDTTDAMYSYPTLPYYIFRSGTSMYQNSLHTDVGENRYECSVI